MPDPLPARSFWRDPVVAGLLVAAAGVVVAVFALIFAIWAWGMDREPPGTPTPTQTVLLKDDRGNPRTDTVAIAPDGEEFHAGPGGLLVVSLDRGGQTFEVFESSTRRWLCDFQLNVVPGRTLHVEVPR